MGQIVRDVGEVVGDCPDTSRTATRSTCLVAVTLPSTGNSTRAWYNSASPAIVITPGQRRR
jgi:hypothetical protein